MHQQGEVVGATQLLSTRTNGSSLCELQGLIDNLIQNRRI